MSIPRTDLDRSLVHGIAWTSAVTWLSQLLSWGSTFYVAHKLQTEDYGLVGSSALYIAAIAMVSEFGLGAAVVRFQSLAREEVAQFNALSVMLGAAAMLVSWALAVPVGRFLHQPLLPSLMMVMSVTFVITAFRVVPQAVMQREMRFRRLALMEGTQSICAATANITMASLGFDYWTLALGPLIGQTVFMTLVVSSNPLPFKRPKLNAIREPFEFSKQTIFTRFAWFGYSNADFFIIPKVLGTHAMGLYTMGWQMAGIAVEKITALIGRVTPAFFSTIQHDVRELRHYLLLLTEDLAFLTFPVCVGIALVADDLVRVIGPQWGEAAFPLRALALLATVRSIDPLIQQVMSAIGEARLNLRNAIRTICVLPFVFFFAAGGWGINGVAVAWLIGGPLLFTPLLLQALKRLEIPASTYFSALWPAISGCLVMSAVVISVRWFLLGDASPVVALVVQAITGAIAYAGALFVLHRNRVLAIRSVMNVLKSRNSGVKGSGASRAD